MLYTRHFTYFTSFSRWAGGVLSTDAIPRRCVPDSSTEPGCGNDPKEELPLWLWQRGRQGKVLLHGKGKFIHSLTPPALTGRKCTMYHSHRKEQLRHWTCMWSSRVYQWGPHKFTFGVVSWSVVNWDHEHRWCRGDDWCICHIVVGGELSTVYWRQVSGTCLVAFNTDRRIPLLRRGSRTAEASAEERKCWFSTFSPLRRRDGFFTSDPERRRKCYGTRVIEREAL